MNAASMFLPSTMGISFLADTRGGLRIDVAWGTYHKEPLDGYPDARDECWHVYYGDVHAGTLAIRTGNPHDTEPWEWRCGFYPGSRPGECSSGTSASFEEARADFETAGQAFLSKRTEADFQAWRAQRDWTARKYALWDAGKRLEPPNYGPGTALATNSSRSG
jgi:hypothetical protein